VGKLKRSSSKNRPPAWVRAGKLPAERS